MLGISELGDELRMSRSTVHRYAITLEALGYLERTSSRKYKLGLRAHDLGMRVLDRGGLREHAWPYLKQLSTRYPAIATVSVLDSQEIICLACARNHRVALDPELLLRTGSRLPAYCTAAGKVLLASLAPRALKQTIAQLKMRTLASGTITSKARLRDALTQIAEGDLLAVCDEEFAPQLLAIAVPLLSNDKPIAALEIAVNHKYVSRADLTADFAPELLQAARRITRALSVHRRPSCLG